MRLVLRTTVIIDPIADDYVVHDKEPGINVGRIRLTGFPGGERRWNWYLQAPNPFEAGTADTLETAKAAFKAAWMRRKPEMSEAKLLAIKHWDETEGRRHERRATVAEGDCGDTIPIAAGWHEVRTMSKASP
jgi:hypothetical protein